MQIKLTEKQKAVIELAKELESKYGKGNIFLRWINDSYKIQFIVHLIGTNTYNILGYKINGTVCNALEKKGLLTCCDNMHNEDVDPNSWRDQPEGWLCIGSRVKTELVT